VGTVCASICVSLVASSLLTASGADSTAGEAETYVSADESASRVSHTASGIGYQIPSSPDTRC
jgi:hypothetical protein